MGFFDFFRKKSEEPAQVAPTPAPVVMEAQPISVNPSSPAQLKRHVGRLANLYAAQAKGQDGLEQEIVQRKAAVIAFGHSAPEDEAAARELLARMEA